jgi:hypothetical protein
MAAPGRLSKGKKYPAPYSSRRTSQEAAMIPLLEIFYIEMIA